VLGVSWTDVVGVKGVRDAKESRASELVCLVVPAGGVAGVVASMEWCPTRHVVGATSPCPVEYSCGTGCGS